MSRIFIIAGEISGDTHAAGLMREIIAQDAEAKFLGLGGTQMRAVSPGIDDWVADAAVVGLSEVVKRYSYFKQRFDACLEAVGTEKPDAVVLVDYPGLISVWRRRSGIRSSRRGSFTTSARRSGPGRRDGSRRWRGRWIW